MKQPFELLVIHRTKDEVGDKIVLGPMCVLATNEEQVKIMGARVVESKYESDQLDIICRPFK